MVQSRVLTYPPSSLQDGNGLCIYSSYSSLSVHIIGETYQSVEVGETFQSMESAAFAVYDEVVSNFQSWITTHDERHLSAALRVTRNQRGDT